MTPDSPDRSVAINIATGLCKFANEREIHLKQLLNSDFSHPLLTEPFHQPSDNLFHYEYATIDELFYSAIYVYSVLLHVNKPQECQFKINPSSAFQHSPFAKEICFSIGNYKFARERLSIKQLNDLMTHFAGSQFEFTETMMINDRFTMADLPQVVDGDVLYELDSKIIELLKAPIDWKRYELRYINPTIGFGVFSNQIIKKGELISFYTGLKSIHRFPRSSYVYTNQFDKLNMCLDAFKFGNLSKFVNHAPNSDPNDVTSRRTSLCTANITGLHQLVRGIDIFVYLAKKDILPGEQLLVNYGPDYFKNNASHRFKTNGQPLSVSKKVLGHHLQRKINHLRIMSQYGVQKAQIFLLLRTCGLVVGLSLIIELFINVVLPNVYP